MKKIEEFQFSKEKKLTPIPVISDESMELVVLPEIVQENFIFNLKGTPKNKRIVFKEFHLTPIIDKIKNKKKKILSIKGVCGKKCKKLIKSH